MARTGKWMAHQHSGIRPDVITLAKGLGNGFPIGACLARGAAAAVFKPGNHGSTFGGNPLACVAAETTLSIIENEGLLHRSSALGSTLVEGLRRQLAGVVGVKQIRGLGLMIGIELDRPCSELVSRGLDAGLLINVTADNVVRLLPPLILSDADAKLIVDGVGTLIRDFTGAQTAVAS